MAYFDLLGTRRLGRYFPVLVRRTVLASPRSEPRILMPASRVVSFTEIEAGGNFVTYDPPRLKMVGPLHAMTLTHEDRPPDADVGCIRVQVVNSISATS
jgi:hypothetical protein